MDRVNNFSTLSKIGSLILEKTEEQFKSIGSTEFTEFSAPLRRDKPKKPKPRQKRGNARNIFLETNDVDMADDVRKHSPVTGPRRQALDQGEYSQEEEVYDYDVIQELHNAHYKHVVSQLPTADLFEPNAYGKKLGWTKPITAPKPPWVPDQPHGFGRRLDEDESPKRRSPSTGDSPKSKGKGGDHLRAANKAVAGLSKSTPEAPGTKRPIGGGKGHDWAAMFGGEGGRGSPSANSPLPVFPGSPLAVSGQGEPNEKKGFRAMRHALKAITAARRLSNTWDPQPFKSVTLTRQGSGIGEAWDAAIAKPFDPVTRMNNVKSLDSLQNKPLAPQHAMLVRQTAAYFPILPVVPPTPDIAPFVDPEDMLPEPKQGSNRDLGISEFLKAAAPDEMEEEEEEQHVEEEEKKKANQKTEKAADSLAGLLVQEMVTQNDVHKEFLPQVKTRDKQASSPSSKPSANVARVLAKGISLTEDEPAPLPNRKSDGSGGNFLSNLRTDLKSEFNNRSILHRSVEIKHFGDQLELPDADDHPNATWKKHSLHSTQNAALTRSRPKEEKRRQGVAVPQSANIVTPGMRSMSLEHTSSVKELTPIAHLPKAAPKADSPTELKSALKKTDNPSAESQESIIKPFGGKALSTDKNRGKWQSAQQRRKSTSPDRVSAFQPVNSSAPERKGVLQSEKSSAKPNSDIPSPSNQLTAGGFTAWSPRWP